MMIPLATPVDVVERLYVEMRSHAVEYCYQHCMRRLHLWMGMLRWAYVPLENDSVFGMFVTRNEDGALVDRVFHAFGASCQQEMFQVAINGADFTWGGEISIDPSEWDSQRRKT